MTMQTTSQSPMVMKNFNNAEQICKKLLESKHYSKMGYEGVFAITQKAISKGLDPLEALNGGMYYVNGKVEMSSITMASLIRSKGHSITLGKESNDSICILHGKRKDNGDTWKVSFSIEDAKQAGIYKGAWIKYPGTMCYNRALSKLARQLFPDVIGNCYVEGEIKDAPPLDENIPIHEEVSIEESLECKSDNAQEKNDKLIVLIDYIETLEGDRKDNFISYVKQKFTVEDLSELSSEECTWLIEKIEQMIAKKETA